MNARRHYALTVLGTVVSGGIAFFGASRPWQSMTLVTEGLPSDTVSVTGNEALPVVGALSLVVMAGALAVLATRGRVRLAVGVLIILSGTGGIAAMLLGIGGMDDVFVQAVKESPAYVGTGVPERRFTPWLLLTGLGFACATGFGGWVTRFGHLWPAMSGRYDAPGAQKESRPRITGRPEDAAGNELWAELDEGRDPTE